MDKVVIFSSTNRPDSNTFKVSKIYERILHAAGAETLFLDFTTLPQTLAFSESFGRRTVPYAGLVNEFVVTKNRFVFVVPEYNGSFPGILKTFLDSTHPRDWANKKACLVGVSDGRAGNLRGMEHLTGILQYLKMHVYHNKLPISLVNKVMLAEGAFSEEQLRASTMQIEGFLGF